MTQPHRILWFAIVAAAVCLLSIPASLRAQSLHVTSFPDGANVLVDGVDTRKVTPMSVSLEAGTHTVVVQLSKLTGWNVDTRSVTITNGDNYLSVTLLPTLTTGSPGPQGPAGPEGPQGLMGQQGIPGLSITGPQGPQGPEGPQGLMGQQGIPGLSITGPQGAPGPQGPAGPAGPAGAAGAPGANGVQGPPGINNQGAWNSTTAYSLGDAVFDAGSYWLATVPNTNSDPSPINTSWQILAAGINNRGTWQSTAAYNANDAVTDSGSFWLALVANTNSEPSSSNFFWLQLAAQGAAGPAGSPGAPGAPGATGAAGPQGPPGPAGPAGPQGPAGTNGSGVLADSGQNTAAGTGALASVTFGVGNSAFGASALGHDTGTENSAFGRSALYSNVGGNYNSALGTTALFSNVAGNFNSAFGFQALESSTGNYNIGMGPYAGSYLTSGVGNIYIGSAGTPGGTESGAIRIGTSTDGTGLPLQTSTYIAGIFGTTLVGGGTAVFIDSNSQLGTVSSSRRYKEDIQPMADASERLLKLRPLTFGYKKPNAQGEKPIQYGLIAEEVAEVFPELVVLNKDGQPETVAYHLLASLLVNELQKEHRLNQEHTRQLAAQQKQLDIQSAQLADIDALKAKLAYLERLTTRLAVANGADSDKVQKSSHAALDSSQTSAVPQQLSPH